MNIPSKSTKGIGTWNLDGKWSSEHRSKLLAQRCDIWLLTEVSTKILNDDLIASEYHIHHTSGHMTSVKYWSAILSASQLTPLQDPHPASAAAVINGIVYCSSILPWATCGSEPAQPWRGSTLEAKTKGALESIKELLKDKRVVWGGDWNQNLSGGWEHVGSRGMQDAINSVLTSLGLRVVTSELPHRIQGSHTIDHIAVPADWTDFTAEKISAVGLSDHDLYCIEVPKTKIMRTMRSSEHLHDSENSQAEKSLTDADLLAMIDALTPEDQRRLEVVLQGALSGKLPEE